MRLVSSMMMSLPVMSVKVTGRSGSGCSATGWTVVRASAVAGPWQWRRWLAASSVWSAPTPTPLPPIEQALAMLSTNASAMPNAARGRVVEVGAADAAVRSARSLPVNRDLYEALMPDVCLVNDIQLGKLNV